jgi:hypothetical protein
VNGIHRDLLEDQDIATVYDVPQHDSMDGGMEKDELD